MKKILSLIIAALVLLSLAACSNGASGQGEGTDDSTNLQGSPDSGENPDTDNITEENNDTYELKLDNGVTVVIGGSADEAVTALGEYIDYMEAPSCVHPGFDKVYTYDGFTLTTSPDAKGNEFVFSIVLTSDVVGLDNGLMIGSSLSDVEAAFGSDYEESFGIYSYSLTGVTVSATIDGETVSGLTFSSTRS